MAFTLNSGEFDLVAGFIGMVFKNCSDKTSLTVAFPAGHPCRYVSSVSEGSEIIQIGWPESNLSPTCGNRHC